MEPCLNVQWRVTNEKDWMQKTHLSKGWLITCQIIFLCPSSWSNRDALEVVARLSEQTEKVGRG